MKKIVICCDGTWNTPDQDADGVPRPTNVSRLAAAVADEGPDGSEQLTYYGTGVGAEGCWLRRAFDGATGWGLSRNLLDAYAFLVSHYEPGDELFLFGFSRGAFTVRSLGGLINNSGILKPPHERLIERAYDLYRARSKRSHPRSAESELFRKTYAWQDKTSIKYIGVWDTVGALGNPLIFGFLSGRLHRFHDAELSSTVENAYHAMAVDEKRKHFAPTLWKRQDDSDQQSVEQRWFIGVHSDVGGGTAKPGLSDLALEWVAERARQCGLGISDLDTEPSWEEGPGESRTGFYRLIRPHPRGIAAESAKNTFETLDDSVRKRYRSDAEYRPPNLDDYFERHPEKSSDESCL